MSDFYSILVGDYNSNIVIHVPHGSRFIPPNVRDDIKLNDIELGVELDRMTDTYTEELALLVQEISKTRPWLFVNNVSRFVIDPERFPDESEVMNSVGMGAVYTKTSSGVSLREEDSDIADNLLNTYFQPYSKAFEELITHLLTHKDHVLILDIHSYRINVGKNELNAKLRRPEFCLGTDFFHTPKDIIGAFEAGLSTSGQVLINEPFAGTYVPLKYYNQDERVKSIMLEIREDMLVDRSLQPIANLSNIVNTIAKIINNL